MQAYDDGKLDGLHSVLVMLKGELFAEVHFRGDDERWGEPLRDRQHSPQTLHDLRSVSKSIVALLYGIALSEGKVPGLDESLIAQFRQYEDLAADPKRQAITIRDVLTMQMGTEWNEDLPYTDRRNSEIAMELADDRYRFVLDRPMVTEPGTEWRYSGGATALLGRLIAVGAGMPLDAYAQEELFGPLGIERFEWIAGEDGEPSAASGLRLTVHGLAKIGQMISNGGRYCDDQIVPEAWLAEAFTPATTLDSGLRYGLHWYLSANGNPPGWMSGFGNGGQRITIQPQYDLVFVTFAGNYNQRDAWKVPVRLIEEILVPALDKELKGR
ncbi:MAG: serine hydrolase [Hyphomicrobiales bacterium]|nr:serine hydrolase [Hyphomicrobiales bacterium]MCP4997218.1 serine hydrolase [Hyphomicrobiales bacterium]